MQAQAECATEVWREPDQGIWEARGKPQHYVSSKLMCWVAMDRASKLAAMRGDAERKAAWRATAEEIKADILDHGRHQDGVLRQHYETDALDASNLLAAIFGFLPGDDERLRASVLAIADDLTEDGFVLRYRTDETDDGMSGKEGSFLICSFWLVSGLAIVGEHQRARDLMEKLLRVASPLGLYAEEFDTSTGQAPRQLPSGLLPPRADRGRRAHHPRRAHRGVLMTILRRHHHRNRRGRRYAGAASASRAHGLRDHGRGGVRALDQRLLRYARATRTFLFVSVSLGALSALLIVAQAWLLADVVSRAFLGGRSLAQLHAPLLLLFVVVLARAGVAWGAELAAGRSSARAKSQLRGALLERIPALGLDGSREQRTGELAILATRGIDALDGYFSLYLPQLFLAVIVPVVVIAAVLWNDWISAAIIAFTIPLIPAVHGAGGRQHARAHGPSVPHARAPRRPLPRRRRADCRR